MRPILPHQPPPIVHEATKRCAVLVEKATIAALRGTESLIEAGKALAEAKACCPHGEWLPLLARLDWNPRTAQRLIVKSKCDKVSYLESFADDESPSDHPKPGESRARLVATIQPPPDAGDAWEPPSEPPPSEPPPASRSTEPQNGQVRMDWAGYHLHYGGLVRIYNHFAKTMGQVDERGAVVGDVHYKGIMRKLDEILKDTDAWYTKLTGTKPPRH